MGGKGASLAALQAEARVPACAVAGTDLFRQFLQANRIEEVYARYWQAVLHGGPQGACLIESGTD